MADELTPEQIEARAARRAAREAAAAGVTEIVAVDGVTLQRTTTVIDVTPDELQEQLVKLDDQIDATTRQYVAPLREQRRKLVDELATLTG